MAETVQPVGLAARSVRQFPLAGKFATLFAIASLLVGLISFFALDRVLSPIFSEIEQRAADSQIARAEFALHTTDRQLMHKATDYAVWDATYNHVIEPSAAYRDEMFTPGTLGNLGIEYLGIVRFDGTVLDSYAFNANAPVAALGEAAKLGKKISSEAFITAAKNKEILTTYLETSQGIYAVAASRILRSGSIGPSSGYLVIGMQVSESDLSQSLQVPTQLKTIGNVATTEQLRDRLAGKNGFYSISDDEIRSVLALRDIDGKLLGTIHFATQRTISEAGQDAVESAIIAMALSLMALAIIIALGVNIVAVRRLKALQKYVGQFNSNRQPIALKLSKNRDEIGSLARQFDVMAVELREAEEELRQQSYVQGKADSAVGLLHNIRNALGPLQVKHEKWQKEEGLPFRQQLVLALDELDTGNGGGSEAGRREALQSFVVKVTRRMIEQSDVRAEEMADIRGSIDHIVAVLKDYDFDSSAKPVIENVDPSDIIKREIADREAVEDQKIILEFTDVMPKIRANRLHLSQLIGNLMTNAVESMRDFGSDPMRLTVSIVPATGGRVAIGITDNGGGAAQDTLAKAFDRGFSTREEKSGGAGLHWSANAANAMDGKLGLESPGIGKGATVWLTLPLADAARPFDADPAAPQPSDDDQPGQEQAAIAA